MRAGISIDVSPSDRRRFEALVCDRNTAQKLVWRAEIVLLSAASIGKVEHMRRTGKSKTEVWQRQERCAEMAFESQSEIGQTTSPAGPGRNAKMIVNQPLL